MSDSSESGEQFKLWNTCRLLSFVWLLLVWQSDNLSPCHPYNFMNALFVQQSDRCS